MSSVQEMLSHPGADEIRAATTPVDSASTGGRDWQQELADAIRTPQSLWDSLKLPRALLPSAVEAAKQFPVLVPHSFLNRMEPGNIHDPLLRQVLPVQEETVDADGFTADPVGDQQAKSAPGLIQKYAGRVLVMLQGTCAVHCRYCFRRHYPYEEEPRSLAQWEGTLNTIAADPSIHEVILSGGDPLILGDAKLSQFISRLEAIPHLQRLRIHSRLPIVLPSRITADLLKTLTTTRLQAVMVIHANHGNELVADCEVALRSLVTSGIPTLNQAVLLQGVNDSVEALVDLCERCINLGVMPYYLHQLDRVRGAAHFEVPLQSDEAGNSHQNASLRCGRDLIQALRARLPGYAVPRFVQEVAGEDSKTPL